MAGSEVINTGAPRGTCTSAGNWNVQGGCQDIASEWFKHQMQLLKAQFC
jgi:hypothetical protein